MKSVAILTLAATASAFAPAAVTKQNSALNAVFDD